MEKNNRVQYIDTWRFFAIALVIISHLIEFSHPIYKAAMPGLIWRIHPLGRLGVHVFFCISGYVICHGMLKESETYGSLSLRNFYIRRVFRILPPLALYMGFIAIMVQLGMFDVQSVQFAQAGGFLCNIESIGDCGWYFGHTWSLAFEEQFYLIFPLLFSAIALAKQRRRLLIIVVSLVFAPVALRLSSHPALAYYLSIFSFMLWGCVYALFQDMLAPALERMPISIWLAICGLLLGINFIALPETFTNFCYPIFAPLAICAIVFGTPLRHPLVRKVFLNLRLAYLGQISYTVYLWQQAATKNYGFESPLAAVVMIGFVFILADISYKRFEIPFIRLGRTMSTRQPTHALEIPATGIAADGACPSHDRL